MSRRQKLLAGIENPTYGVPVALLNEPDVIVEGKTLRLYRDAKEMIEALKRAHGIVARVNASVVRDRGSTRGRSMNEKSLADMYRLDQEIGTALDALQGAREALEDVRKQQRTARR